MTNISKWTAEDFGHTFLQDVIDFISQQFAIDDIFDDDTIKDFIQTGNFTEANCRPEDVFDPETLAQWALENGFIEKEE